VGRARAVEQRCDGSRADGSLYCAVLAVFTLVVLLRESVKRMFEANKVIAARVA